ncbi:unnamed protein product [Polarella glacialis]|uniref:Uncharacterized protein n=1 Tax=Polarella glacialis TaxID=89957 RepID=A0A813E6K7_POLGL|nr:unnamed protein product [Polarella glacialis]
MEHILMYTAFCKAHVHAQHEFVEFFGQQGMPRSGEQACVILESHTLVYRASVAALRAASTLEQEALDDLNILREGTAAVESMRKFIGHAQEQNVISSSAAETLMEPMVNKQQDWINHIHGVELGTATGAKNMPSLAADKSESYRITDDFTGAVPPAVRKAPKAKAGWGSCMGTLPEVHLLQHAAAEAFLSYVFWGWA